MKIVKNTAAVSSILSSTISVLVAAVPPLSILRRTPIKETKVTSGGSGVGGRPPLFSASAYMRHIRGEFLPEEREKGIYIYIHACFMHRPPPRPIPFRTFFRISFQFRDSRNSVLVAVIVNNRRWRPRMMFEKRISDRFRSLERLDRAKL